MKFLTAVIVVVTVAVPATQAQAGHLDDLLAGESSPEMSLTTAYFDPSGVALANMCYAPSCHGPDGCPKCDDIDCSTVCGGWQYTARCQECYRKVSDCRAAHGCD